MVPVSEAERVAETRVPVVAVVGRPNVGKSTLVNRVLGSRQAVVQDVPGVTRDRVTYDASWRGRAFTLVDTGGWEPFPGAEAGQSSRALAEQVTAQAQVAVQAADAVLFVVDAVVGITDADAAVAAVLRRSGRPVILAANKVDDAPAEPAATALWSLGLGEPLPVSALHGRGSGDLLDALLDALPPAPREILDAAGGPRRVALIGRPNVGKSSLLNKLAGETRVLVDDVAGTTRDPVDELIELGGQTWRFVDTAGIRRRAKESQGADFYAALRTAGALERAEVAVVLVDASDPLTEQDLRIVSTVIEAGRALVIGYNKWDLVDTERREQLDREIDRQLHTARWAPRVNISALTGRHVQPAGARPGAGAAQLGDQGPDRPSQRLAERGDRGHPAAVAWRQAAEDPVRHPGGHPAAACGAVHHRVPGGRVPPVHRAEAARGVRLRGQPAPGIAAAPGAAAASGQPDRPGPLPHPALARGTTHHRDDRTSLNTGRPPPGAARLRMRGGRPAV